MRMQALADELFLDKSTASRVINALERKSYVIRLAESGDRRAVKLQATDAGRTLCENIRRDLIAEEKLKILPVGFDQVPVGSVGEQAVDVLV
uniref:HTH marR-type domain-containing protein n=1 Tax=Ectopseudomonas oleovorans TaxID=301 RepID=A0A653BBS3_ECTOL